MSSRIRDGRQSNSKQYAFFGAGDARRVTLTGCIFDKKYTSNWKFSTVALCCENLIFASDGDKNHPARRWVRFTSVPTWRSADPESRPVGNKEWGCVQRLRRRHGEPRNQLDA
jgi:hypothetical protein